MDLHRREGNHVFSDDADKFSYLDSLLNFYIEMQPHVERARLVVYSCVISDKEWKPFFDLGGYDGKVGTRSEGGAVPFSLFVRDLICLREMLDCNHVENTPAVEFNNTLLGYVTAQYLSRNLSGPVVEVTEDQSFGDLVKDLGYAELTYPADHVQRLGANFRKLWIPRIVKNIEGYDASEINEDISISFE